MNLIFGAPTKTGQMGKNHLKGDEMGIIYKCICGKIGLHPQCKAEKHDNSRNAGHKMKKKLGDLLKIMADNPGLSVKFMVYYEVICDDWGYWLADLENIDVDYVWLGCERYYIGEDEIKERLADDCCDDVPKEMSDEEYNYLVDLKFSELCKKGEIQESINVYINN